jgi:hypothetical protein
MRAGTSQEVILFVSKMRRQSAGGETPIYRGKNGACTRCLHAKTNGLTLFKPRARAGATAPDHLHINSKCLRRAEVPIAISAAHTF